MGVAKRGKGGGEQLLSRGKKKKGLLRCNYSRDKKEHVKKKKEGE